MEDITRKSSDRLKQERLRSGYTQEGLAKDITTQQQITYLEKGKRKLSYDMAFPIAKKLKVRVEYLMGMDDFRTEKDLIANHVSKTNDYFNNLDIQFEKFLDALEITISVEYNSTSTKTTIVTVDDKLNEVNKPKVSIEQNINYVIETPTEKKVMTEKEFIKFKDQICKYVIFLTETI